MKTILLCLFCLTTLNFPQNEWFPLSVGNTWQSIYRERNYDHIILNVYITLNKKEVTDQIEYAGKVYYKYENQWMRYADNKVIILHDSVEYVHLDFNLPPGTIFQQFNNGYFHPVQIIGGYEEYFGSFVEYKGIFNEGQIKKYIKGFGLCFDSSYYSVGWRASITDDHYVMALIKNNAGNFVLFSENIKPRIFANPFLYSSGNFNWLINVTHEYSLTGNMSSVNYVDSVFFEGYYSLNDSLFNPPVKAAFSANSSNYYSFITSLDTVRLKNGWTFKYRALAIDKGLVKDSVVTPKSGYFTCKWHTLASVRGNDIPLNNFELYQNYPNPFNPSTNISYSLPEKSKIIITVYNILGEVKSILLNGEQESGKHNIPFNAIDLPSGIYIYTLKTENQIISKKMCLLH